jgi:hypothetical protein
VRAAALKAVSRLDPPAAKAAALGELVAGSSGRVGRAASVVLRAATLGDADFSVLERIARETESPVGQRLRALALLRRARWRHLVVVMQTRRTAQPPLLDVLDQELRAWIAASATVSRGPLEEHRRLVEQMLPELDESRRRSIEFVLRTAG